MADEVDICNDAILRAAEERTAQIRASLQGEGQDECEECGCEIPAARRSAAPWAIRCAPCQEIEDQKGRHCRG